MKNCKITILTDTLPYGKNFLFVHAKIFFRSLRNLIFKSKFRYYNSEYGGHPAVTRSLVEGFKKCKIKFNYNPKKIDNLYENVIVLSGVNTLKQAIFFKKKGYIKKLFAGPNIVNFAKNENYLLGSPEIDTIIVPSAWVSYIYQKDIPSIKKKIFICPSGVDKSYWFFNKKIKNQILVYIKTDSSNNNLNLYLGFLKKLSLKCKILLVNKNNRYSSKKFRELLQSSRMMIGLSKSESQGICWAEAWAMNVPTLIQFKSSNLIEGRKVAVSSAPYLSKDTGLFFKKSKDFKKKVKFILKNPQTFSPRHWVLKNMTDEIVAKKIYKKIFSNKI